MRKRICRWACAFALLGGGPSSLFAQSRVEPVPFGDFEQWLVREITESGVIGGKTHFVYAVAPNDTVVGSIPYVGKNGWSSSNVMAKVMGIVKTSVTVFPDKRDGGRCARLETRFAQCKVLGLVNIKVLASGTLFWGETIEPIKDASNPYEKINMGVPFTKRPKALMLDYKARISAEGKLTKATGTHTTTFSGEDPAEITLFLQHRWEDADGNLHARRVGTGGLRVAKTTPGWQNDKQIEVIYGNASSDARYRPYMAITPADRPLYAKNSKGEMVPIREEGWGKADEPVTHAILMISSGSQGAYVGALGNTLWVDNVRLVY